MAMSVRTFLQSIAALAVAVAGGRAVAQQPRERLTLSSFIARARTDAELRARFAANPRAALADHGIDSVPYNLPDRVSAEQMDRLLDDLSRVAAAPPVNPGPAPTPAPVYGPPAAAVYGPPPGMRRP